MNHFYMDKIEGMGEDEILKEITKLGEILARPLSATSSQQVQEMMLMAQERYSDVMKIKMFEEQRKANKNKPDAKDDSVINIGVIKSDVYTPDYTKSELVEITSKLYQESDTKK